MEPLLVIGWIIKTLIRMVVLFLFFGFVVFGFSCTMAAIQVKDALFNLIIEYSSGWVIDLVAAIDWLITGGIAVVVIMGIVWLAGKYVEKLFFLRRPYTFKDVIPYLIVMFIVILICAPQICSIFSESFRADMEIISYDLIYSQMMTPIDEVTCAVYLSVGILVGSFFLIRTAFDKFKS